MVIMNTWKLHWFAGACGALTALTPAGHVTAQHAEIFIVAPPPEAVEEYPSVVYEVHPVYYVHGRWYYRHGDDWVYYREPPARLRERHEREMIEREREHDRIMLERERDRAHEAAIREHERDRAVHEEVREHERDRAAREAAVHEHERDHAAREAAIHEHERAPREAEVREQQRHDRRDRHARPER
jgi:hypothetical protein